MIESGQVKRIIDAHGIAGLTGYCERKSAGRVFQQNWSMAAEATAAVNVCFFSLRAPDQTGRSRPDAVVRGRAAEWLLLAVSGRTAFGGQ
jgi:hypothetical protein